MHLTVQFLLVSSSPEIPLALERWFLIPSGLCSNHLTTAVSIHLISVGFNFNSFIHCTLTHS